MIPLPKNLFTGKLVAVVRSFVNLTYLSTWDPESEERTLGECRSHEIGKLGHTNATGLEMFC